MEFVQLVIKTTTGNTVVRQPISWAWPGNRCMSQVTARNLHSTLGDAATADQSDQLVAFEKAFLFNGAERCAWPAAAATFSNAIESPTSSTGSKVLQILPRFLLQEVKAF